MHIGMIDAIEEELNLTYLSFFPSLLNITASLNVSSTVISQFSVSPFVLLSLSHFPS